VAAGAFAGLAGGQLALGLVGLFNQGMVAGRGYIALAAFYFGRARPLPTAVACAVFALFDAIQIRLQQEGLSTQLVSTLPYLVVVAVLTATAVGARRRGQPVEVAT
jgi:simple sugar transport system permease protein